MNEESNIFLRMLQIGVEKKEQTISFNEILKTINDEFSFNKNLIPIIRRWFYDYFYTSGTFRAKSGISANDMIDYELKKHDDEKAFFTGDGFFKYYEYLEVKKAYKNAEDASKQAKIALDWVKISLFVAIAVGVSQILLMVFQ